MLPSRKSSCFCIQGVLLVFPAVLVTHSLTRRMEHAALSLLSPRLSLITEHNSSCDVPYTRALTWVSVNLKTATLDCAEWQSVCSVTVLCPPSTVPAPWTTFPASPWCPQHEPPGPLLLLFWGGVWWKWGSLLGGILDFSHGQAYSSFLKVKGSAMLWGRCI